MQQSARTHLRVLGPARISIGDRPAPPELLWRKHLALLVYLARSPRRARTREHLIGLLWSDRDEKSARHSLSEALRVFRRVLGEGQVLADVDQIRLGESAVVLDCDEFAARRAGADWVGAAALVEGEFLEGLSVPAASEFESWLAAERGAWRSQMVEVLVRCAEEQLAGGALVDAAGYARRALGVDPTAEAAARAVMRALTLWGDRPGALGVAEHLAQALADHLGTRPAPETQRLIERIRESRLGRKVVAATPDAPRRPPLIGRRAQLATITDAWTRAAAGQGQVVLVEGEPGEGKTRLVEEFVARARLEDATVAWARAVPADQNKAWSALAGWLAGGLSEAPGLAGAPAAALTALGQLDPDLATRFPAGATDMPCGEALVAVVRAVAHERPVLLALDDAQWTDSATVTALPALARDFARQCVLLVLGIARGAPEAARFDELRALLGRDLAGTAILLPRFDTAALRDLVGWALPRYGTVESERLVRRLERDTAGIPLLAVATVEAVVDGLKLSPEAPPWPSPTRTLLDSLPGDLPPAVVGAVCLRFRALDPHAQQVLGAAAALGAEERCEAERLARATGLDRATVEPALDRLEWERWLVADARGYAFTAPIVRAILVQEMITPGQARRYRDSAAA